MTEDDKKFQEAINRLSSNTEHWQQVKRILEEDIRGNQELIRLIDAKVKELESKISRLN